MVGDFHALHVDGVVLGALPEFLGGPLDPFAQQRAEAASGADLLDHLDDGVDVAPSELAAGILLR